jgi:hypothetical protein
VGIGIKKGKTIDKTHAETCEFLVVLITLVNTDMTLEGHMKLGHRCGVVVPLLCGSFSKEPKN